MKLIKTILLVSLIILLQGCSTKNLSQAQILNKTLVGCQTNNASLMLIPSRGILADSLAITAIKIAGNDGGFYKDFSKSIINGFKNIALYCPNTQKTEAILLNTLNSYKNNELNDIFICVIGMENSKDLSNEASRTGTNIKFVP